MSQPKWITDEQLLEWIEDGQIRITHLDQRSPRLIFRGRHHSPYLDAQDDKNPRYRWRLSNHGRRLRSGRYRQHRRTIARSKLVWMYSHRSVVPEGQFIHHVDLDRFNDRSSNLEALSEPEHNGVHHGEEW